MNPHSKSGKTHTEEHPGAAFAFSPLFLSLSSLPKQDFHVLQDFSLLDARKMSEFLRKKKSKLV